jgi:hypothetical protein
MSDDVSSLRSLIPTYAGQKDTLDRWLSDQQVRAWTGESLIGLQERVALDGHQERFDRLLVHCEFGDQRVIKAFESEALAAPQAAAAVEAQDAKLVLLAERAKTIEADGVGAFIDEVERAFEERAATVAELLKG